MLIALILSYACFLLLCWVSYERGYLRGRIDEIEDRSDRFVQSVHEENLRRFSR